MLNGQNCWWCLSPVMYIWFEIHMNKHPWFSFLCFCACTLIKDDDIHLGKLRTTTFLIRHVFITTRCHILHRLTSAKRFNLRRQTPYLEGLWKASSQVTSSIHQQAHWLETNLVWRWIIEEQDNPSSCKTSWWS